MKYLGDITKIKGSEIDPVDVITGGSPCQDLSIAGNRVGLSGERSGLFMEQIRVIKELRDACRMRRKPDQPLRPRYMVWENVPGAFSSNGGKDFRAVLSETVRIAEPEAPDVPLPDKGKWPLAGLLLGEHWSVAWRTHDAQWWGVPQRRKRICVLADYDGHTAGELLFGQELDGEAGHADIEQAVGCVGAEPRPEIQSLSEGVPGDIEPGKTPREEAPGGAGGGAYPAVANTLTARHDGSPQPDKGDGANIVVQAGRDLLLSDDVAMPLRASEHGNQQAVLSPTYCLQGNCIDRADTAGCNGRGWCEDVSYTLNTIDRPAVMAFAQNQLGEVRASEVSGTLNTNSNASGRNAPLVYDGRGSASTDRVIAFAQNQRDEVRDLGDTAGSLAAEPGMKQQTFIYDARGNGDGETSPTLTGDHQNRVTDYTALCIGNGQLNQISMAEQANTLDTMHDQQAVLTGCLTPWDTQTTRVYGEDGAWPTLNSGENSGQNRQSVLIQEVAHALKAKGSCDMREDSETYVCRTVVRRLTPLECERLQGLPDGYTDIGDWTDERGKIHHTSDSARYKAIGNGIALPFWRWLLKRISARYRDHTPTLGSLFDGIGGFPYLWEVINGSGTARWASEIEPFAIAVSKLRIGDVEE